MNRWRAQSSLEVSRVLFANEPGDGFEDVTKEKFVSYTQLDDASQSYDATDEAEVEEQDDSILNRLRLSR